MWRFLFSPYGRMSRKTYWLNWILPYIGVSIVVTLLDFAIFPIDPVSGQPPPVFQTITGLILLWPSLATTTKRLHDRGMTGWWQLAPAIAIVPLAGAAYWYYTAKMTGADPVTGSPVVMIMILVLSLIALAVTLYLVVHTLFLRGQTGDNRYGPDPLAPNQAEIFS
jgi:uncharacterized membrane protein YhaH (DUF805 family)